MARYKKINIDLFRGIFTNSDPENIGNENALWLTNLKPWNGRLVLSKNLAVDPLRPLSEDDPPMDPAAIATLNGFIEFQNDNISVLGVSYDSIYLAIGIASDGEVTVYAIDPSDGEWKNTDAIYTDTGSPLESIIEFDTKTYLYKQINSIIATWDAIRIVSGNKSVVSTNSVTPLWIGWIDRRIFDGQFSIPDKFWAYNAQILNTPGDVTLSFTRQFMNDDALIYDVDAIAKSTTVIAISNDFYPARDDASYNGITVLVNGEDERVVDSYDAKNRQLTLHTALNNTTIGDTVSLRFPENYALRPKEELESKYYRYSLVYDYSQESLLSEEIFDVAVGGNEAVIIKVNVSKDINYRVTKANIYRAVKKNGKYYKISSIDLTRDSSDVLVDTGVVECMTKVFVEELSTYSFSYGTNYYLYLYDIDIPDAEVTGAVYRPKYEFPAHESYKLDIGSILNGADNNYFTVDKIYDNTQRSKTQTNKYMWQLYNGSSFVASGVKAYYGPNCVFIRDDLTSYVEKGGNFRLEDSHGVLFSTILDYEQLEEASLTFGLTMLYLKHKIVDMAFTSGVEYPFYGGLPSFVKSNIHWYDGTYDTTTTILGGAGQGLSDDDNAYNLDKIYIGEEGDVFTVIDYNGSAKEFTVDRAMPNYSGAASVKFWFVERVITKPYKISKPVQPFKAYLSGTNYIYETIEYGLLDGAPHPLLGERSINVNGKYGLMHDGRMFYANVVLDPSGAAESHDDWVIYSELNQPDVMPVSNRIIIGDSDGGSITGLQVLGNDIVVTKENSIYMINMAGGDPLNWAARKIAHSVGNISERGALVVRGALYVSYYNGIYRFEPNNLAESDRTPTKHLRINENILDWFDAYNDPATDNPTVYEIVVPHYSPFENVIHFQIYFSDADTHVDWVYDLTTGDWRYMLSSIFDTFKLSFIDKKGVLIGTGNDHSDLFLSYSGSSSRILYKSPVFRLSDIRAEIIRNISITYKSTTTSTAKLYFNIYNADTDAELFEKELSDKSKAGLVLFGARIRAKRFYIKVRSYDTDNYDFTGVTAFELHSITIEHTGD